MLQHLVAALEHGASAGDPLASRCDATASPNVKERPLFILTFVLVKSSICIDLGSPRPRRPLPTCLRRARPPGVTWEIAPSLHLVNIKRLLQGDVFVHKHRTGRPCLLLPWQLSLIKQTAALLASASGPPEQPEVPGGAAAPCTLALLCPDNTWKGVGPVRKQFLGFGPVFCLLWRGCFQAMSPRSSWLSAIRAAIVDYLAHFVSSAFL